VYACTCGCVKHSDVAKADAPIGTMKQLVRAYRLACHYGDSEEEVCVCLHVWVCQSQ